MGELLLRPEIKFKNLEKPFWPEEGYTKGDLLEYYAEILPVLAPHLQDRPITMKRYPDGIRKGFFYQKNYPAYAPEWVGKIPVPFSGEVKDLICVNNEETIMWLVNLGCIEMHSWLSTKCCLDRPDIIIFDLDPSPPSGFKETLPIALVIRDILLDLGLTCYPKSSGSDGLHLYIPVKPDNTYDTVREALKVFCEALAAEINDKVTVSLPKAERNGRIYLDYLQNAYGKTTVSVYSVRPESGAPVSTPLTWEEIKQGAVQAGDFTIKSVLNRVRVMGDLFKPVLTHKQDIAKLLKFTGQKG